MWIHRITGTLILLITIALSIVGIAVVGWELNAEDPHHVTGLIVLFATAFIALGGIFARSRTIRLQWKTNTIMRY